MSAEIQLSAAADQVEFPYRAVSRPAIVSVLLAGLAAVGLIPTFSPMLGMATVGLLAGSFALVSIAKYPDEYSGFAVAMAGLVLNATILFGGIAMHAYIYLTEVPDGYTRVQFYDLQTPDDAPDVPAEKAFEIDGMDVFLKGYIHPSSGNGMLRKFILIPDLGTCCFGGQPRSTDMIEVTLTGGQTVRANMLKHKLAGTFELNQAPRQLNDFDNVVFYRMKVDQIR